MTRQTQTQRVLSAVQRDVPNAAAELYVRYADNRLSEWSEGKPENNIFSESLGVGLRLVENERLGFAYTNTLSTEGVAHLSRQARAACASTAPDADAVLPGPPPISETTPALDLVDASLTADTFSSRSQFLETLQENVLQRDPRFTKILQASYREGTVREVLLSSSGVTAESAATYASFSLGCVAVQGAETQVGYGSQTVCHSQDLNIALVVDKTIRQTLALLDGKQVPSGRYDLILDPWVVAEFLGLFAEALSADQVQKGKSFLGKLSGQVIGSTAITLVDDPRRLRSIGSGVVDAEGQPTARQTLIRQGVLENFLYDSRTARKAKKASSGNAGRRSYKTLPGPEPANFYLLAGTQSPEALIQDVRRGLYVHNVMGFHTVDVIGGDYSLGIMGEFIENGERIHGVRGVTIAGNLLQLLKQIDAAASDLLFTSSFGSPTLRVRDISVGGLG